MVTLRTVSVMYRHIIPKGNPASDTHKWLARKAIDELSDNRAWLVQVTQYRRKRSTEQNAFLHAVPLKLICEHTGYEIEDMKTYLLGQAFGWEEFEIMGERRKRPLKRSSQLNTAEFSFLMEFCERWAAQELSLIIPRPNEYLLEEDTK
jgi:hypothetical protein